MKNYILAFLLLALMANSVHAVKIGTKYFPITCESSSMYPTFDCHSLLDAELPKSKYNLNVGDIIVYSIPSEVKLKNPNFRKINYLIHRIIEVNQSSSTKCFGNGFCIKTYGTFYRTKGDANKVADYWKVYPYKVVYVVTKITKETKVFGFNNTVIDAK